eukprot:TRINITY_DN68066_c0_g1_i1.p1 TRINITY_DN68066_c0_g1~~TRINITY_DN68066_c0_g1_i1.p1  ORF type:complete len:419 (+),score=36.50 TRINITY_DN68066_c0_g1_i1:149-1405(+)
MAFAHYALRKAACTLACAVLVVVGEERPCEGGSICPCPVEPEQGNLSKSLQWSETPRRYTHVQLVGFGIYTSPDGLNSPKNWPSKGQYYPGYQSVSVDMIKRVNVMGVAMENARKSFAVDFRPSTLKVFLAPEFFFRGNSGSYRNTSVYACDNDPENHDCTHPVYWLGRYLEGLVSNDRWRDWLFVFGTVCTGSAGVYYNFSPIFQGGKEGKRFFAFKHWVSSIDFLDCNSSDIASGHPCSPGPNGPLYSELADEATDFLQEMGYQRVVDNMFSLVGIDFGIEICLDHYESLLLNHLRKHNLGGVQVQLIIGSGISINYCVGAITFAQDGSIKAQTLISPSTALATTTPALGEPQEWVEMLRKVFSFDNYIMATEDGQITSNGRFPALNVYPPSPLPRMTPRFSCVTDGPPLVGDEYE